MVELYKTEKSTVSEHIKNIYTDEELTPDATVRKIRTVQNEGPLDRSWAPGLGPRRQTELHFQHSRTQLKMKVRWVGPATGPTKGPTNEATPPFLRLHVAPKA